MLNSLKNCLNSLHKSAKTHVNQLKNLRKFIKRSKPKREFPGFDGVKSSFASMKLSNQLEMVFKFIDANGDGKISPVELSEFLLCLGHDKSKVAEEAAGMLKQMDSNGDGFVDLNEYMDVVMNTTTTTTTTTTDDDDDDYDDDGYGDDGYGDDDGDDDDDDHGLEDDLMDAFLVFDSDKNGLISAKELQLVLKRLGFANCSIKECKLMIKGVDKDGDGFVNFEEFRVMMMGCVRC